MCFLLPISFIQSIVSLDMMKRRSYPSVGWSNRQRRYFCCSLDSVSILCCVDQELSQQCRGGWGGRGGGEVGLVKTTSSHIPLTSRRPIYTAHTPRDNACMAVCVSSGMEKGFNLRRMKQEGGRWVKKGGRGSMVIQPLV